MRLTYSFFFFSSRRRHTRCLSDWSSDVCSSDLSPPLTSSTSAPIAESRKAPSALVEAVVSLQSAPSCADLASASDHADSSLSEADASAWSRLASSCDFSHAAQAPSAFLQYVATAFCLLETHVVVGYGFTF